MTPPLSLCQGAPFGRGQKNVFPDQLIGGVCGNDGSPDSCLNVGLTRGLTLEVKSEAADLDEWWMVCTHRRGLAKAG